MRSIRAAIRCFVLLTTWRGYLDWLVRLGELLREYPVWIRGGQPVKEPDRPRAFADVGQEWKNRFAHLPQYEAWVRVQEGTEIREYNIKTEEIVEVSEDAGEIVDRIRQQSRAKYGVCCDEIEAMMMARLECVEEIAPEPPDADPVE